MSLDYPDRLRVNRRRRKRTASKPSLQLQALFGKPQLLPGESEVGYLDLSDLILADMAPIDAVQQFLVRDIIDVTWDLHRLHAAKASYLRHCYREAAIALIQQYDSKTANELRGANVRTSRINLALKRLKIATSDVNARALMDKFDAMERVERQISQLSARRNSLLLEFEQRREAVYRWRRRELVVTLDALTLPPPSPPPEALEKPDP